MVYDFSKVLQDFNNKNIFNPYLVETDEKRETWTIFDACISAVLLPTSGKQQTGDEKFKAFILAMKIKNCDPTVVDLTVDEAKDVQDAVGLCYGAVIVGVIWKLLNG